MSDARQRLRRNRTLVGCGTGCALVSVCVLLLFWFLGKQAVALLHTGSRFAEGVAAGDPQEAWGLLEPELQRTLTAQDLAAHATWLRAELGTPVKASLTGQRLDPKTSCSVLLFKLSGAKQAGGIEVSVNPNNRPFRVAGYTLDPTPPPVKPAPAPRTAPKGKP